MASKQLDLTNLAPIKNRHCGECSVCCVVLKIDQDDFQKPAGVACRHLSTDSGCSIFQQSHLPKICQTYFCGWRKLPLLGEEWRPDKSGVLIRQDDSSIILQAIRDHNQTLTSDAVLDFMVWCIKQGNKVSISYEKGNDQVNDLIKLNSVLQPYVKAEKTPYLEMKLILLRLMNHGSKHAFI